MQVTFSQSLFSETSPILYGKNKIIGFIKLFRLPLKNNPNNNMVSINKSKFSTENFNRKRQNRFFPLRILDSVQFKHEHLVQPHVR